MLEHYVSESESRNVEFTPDTTYPETEIPCLETSYHLTDEEEPEMDRPCTPANYQIDPETEDWGSDDRSLQWRSKSKKNHVCLEGYVDASDDDKLPRTKSLTDEDLDELKGCVDLGFGFSYEEIPELCNTLPALELCYSMSQKFQDEQQSNSSKSVSDTASTSGSESSSSIANWKISSPGDHPEDVKARLKFWAQAVACTVRLCN